MTRNQPYGLQWVLSGPSAAARSADFGADPLGLAVRKTCIIAGLLLILTAGAARAGVMEPCGLLSYPLIDQGRVMFAQADQSLTALDLETGCVVARITKPHFAGRLTVVGGVGIVATGLGWVSLLDRQTLAVKWERPALGSTPFGQFLFAFTPNREFQVCNLATGAVMASRLEATAFEVAGDRMLISTDRAGPDTEWDANSGRPFSAVEALDADLRVTWRAEKRMLKLGSTGDYAFLTGYYDDPGLECRRMSDGAILWALGKDSCDGFNVQSPFVVLKRTKRLSGDDETSITLEVRNLADGQVVATLVLPRDLPSYSLGDWPVVRAEARRLAFKTWPDLPAQSPSANPIAAKVFTFEGEPVATNAEDEHALWVMPDQSLVWQRQRFPVGIFSSLRAGETRVGIQSTWLNLKDSDAWDANYGLHWTVVHVAPATGAPWRAMVPSHGPVGAGGRALASGSRVVLFGPGGTVECIDIAMRRSLWLYRFRPAMSTLSRWGDGRGPYLSAALRASQWIYSDPDLSLRTFEMPDDFDVLAASPAGRLAYARRHAASGAIWDPNPTGFFQGLGGKIVVAWIAGLGTVLATLLQLISTCRWRRGVTPLAVAALGLATSMLAVTAIFHGYEQMDWCATQMMKIAFFILPGAVILNGLSALAALDRKACLPFTARRAGEIAVGMLNLAVAAILLVDHSSLYYWP